MDDLQERIGALTAEQRALLALRLRRGGEPRAADAPLPPLTRRPAGETPLSFAQARLWFLSQVDPGSAFYNTYAVVRLRGPLDRAALEGSFREIVRRHEVLRTTFRVVEGRPVPHVRAEPEVELRAEAVPGRDAGERDRAVRALAREEIRRPFDLERGPLLRTVLFEVDGDDHVLAVTLHHVVSDRWSVGVLMNELATLYAVLSAGRPSPLPELPVQYADFAWWQRERLKDEIERQLGYWRGRLGDAPPPLGLIPDRPRTKGRPFRGASRAALLPAGLGDRLAGLARGEGATLFMVVLAGYLVLLRRWSRQDDFAVGTPIANRRAAGTQGLIGCFLNTLVLRAPPGGDPSFRELLRRVRETCLEAYAHQDLPFERLVEELRPEHAVGHLPFFQVLFTLNDAHDPSGGRETLAAALQAGGLRMSPLELDEGMVPADLILHAERRADGLALRLEHDADLFGGETAERMLAALGHLLDAAAEDPERRVSALRLMDAAEEWRIVHQLNATSVPYPRDASLAELFEAQAALRPGAPAIVSAERTLTYAELNERANRLARALARRGVVSDVVVGVLMERSPELVVAILAVLKAGGAYLPLEPLYPRDRLAYMVEDARAALLVAPSTLRETAEGLAAPVLSVDGEREAIEAESGDDLPSRSEARHLAYVVYTSGSTGRPKGVEIPQRAVARLVCGADYVELGPEEGIGQLSTPSFDAFTFELWGALLRGGCSVIYPERVPSAAELGDWIRANGVGTLWLTGPLFNAIVDAAPEALRGARQILAGGEALSAAHVRRAMEALPATRLINGYGPTESTTFACCRAIVPEDLEAPSIPIGSPIANTRAYVLDSSLRPVPAGVPGELYLGGDGVARGYRQRSALTAERFVPDPFSAEPGARLYRTGDRARRRGDGAIEFLGRFDTQVKVRGFRVEPGEVEAAFKALPEVRDAVVVARPLRAGGGPELVAYAVPAVLPGPGAEALRRRVAERLPEFLVPARLVEVEALPLTPHGKVDRRALPEPGEGGGEAEYAGPRTPVEERLAEIWAELLGRERVGIHDEFLRLGGNSLLATRMAARASAAFGVALPLRAVFERPVLAELAEAVETLLWAAGAAEADATLPEAEEEELVV